MGGFAGIGGSSAKTDRNTQLSAQQGLWSVFNWALPTGQQQQSAGTGTLANASSSAGTASQYFQNLLSPGRTQATLNAAPAVNASLDASDAARKQAGAFGTGRGGGTAAANANAGAGTRSTIDNIINSNITGGQQAGAQGELGVAGAQTAIGGAQLSNAQSLLGLGTSADTNILNNATTSRVNSQAINQETAAQWESIIGAALGI